ncbi:MAG TPA: hypothetical protein VMC10_19115 [Stellaceae bacterium]|nr:hypothetical protein [Stellaceae bacterium]
MALFALSVLAWSPAARADALPGGVEQAITNSGGNPQALEMAIKAAVTAHPDQAADIAAFGASTFPNQASRVAGAAASVDPAGAAAIVVAVILALPADQQENNAPAIVAAVEDAAPGSTDQITTAITDLAFGPRGSDPNIRPRTGCPVGSCWTDPRHVPAVTTSPNTPVTPVSPT